MTKKDEIINMIKDDIKRRKEWKTKEEQWFYLMEEEISDILFYASGAFPNMRVKELTKIIIEIREETDAYRTLLDEIY